MAAPTTRFKNQATNPATTALDTSAERKTFQGANGTVVDAGGSAPWDFGTVSIAGAVAPVDSAVKHLLWDVSAWGANVAVSNFRAWFAAGTPEEQYGFDNVNTKFKYAALRYESGANGQLYIQNAITSSYTYSDMAHTNTAPAQNLYAGDGATSFGVGDDDVVGMEAYVHVSEAETAGTYQGVTTGYEFRISFRYDYN